MACHYRAWPDNPGIKYWIPDRVRDDVEGESGMTFEMAVEGEAL